MMSVQDWAGLILTTLSIITLVAGGIKWLVKHYLSELKTNGGSSMRDEIKATNREIKEIKDRQDEADMLRRNMDKKLDKMYVILLDHVAKNSKE
jgi:hypothetical protein